MKYGNCLLLALVKWFREGGRIELEWSHTRVAIPRFWHVSKNGVKTRFAPVASKKGWRALFHQIWFRGEIIRSEPKRGNKWLIQ